MTVCVSVKVNDCIVFAADSAITMSREGKIVNVYNSGDKVFNLHRSCPISAMFCGMGTISERSISNLSKELRWELMKGENPLNPDEYEISTVAERAYAFFRQKYAPIAGDPTHSMDFFIGGYGAKSAHGEVWKFTIVNGTINAPQLLRGQGEHGINWGGQITPIGRLLAGIDPTFVQALVAQGADQKAAEAAYELATKRLSTPLYSSAMPTQDVVRLAEFLVDVTKGYFSFAEGSDIVGGPTDVAAITKWEGFRWIKRKHYYPHDLNGENHGHVC